MRVEFLLNDALVFVQAGEIQYLYDEEKIQIISVDGSVYESCASINYEEYTEATKELLVKGYLDLSNNSFVEITE